MIHKTWNENKTLKEIKCVQYGCQKSSPSQTVLQSERLIK